MNAHHSIKKSDDLPVNQQAIDWSHDLLSRLRKTGQRGLLIIQGRREWCLSQLTMLKVFGQPVSISNQADMEHATPFSKAETLLGRESDCVVYDQFSGLQVDVLCMAVGLVKAGGVLVLLMPLNVTAEDRYGRWQDRQNAQPYFHRYMDRYLRENAMVLRVLQAHPLPHIPQWPTAQPAILHDGMSEDQRRVMRTMTRWMDGDKHLFIITADRGRGKSTLLGLFVNRLPVDAEVVVTAASRAQAAILLKAIQHPGRVAFIAPDELLRQSRRIGWLIIDEAAMLPNNLLQQCTEQADKVLLATTTGGYEGTGQGFLLKFLQRFESQAYDLCQLQRPVRWNEHDRLELLFNEMLLLKVEDQPVEMAREDIQLWSVSKQQLHDDQHLLRGVYGLLVSAHYRTRPSDLRQLMDDENQTLLVAGSARGIVGVVLLNQEGGFAPALVEEIFMGRRRPQGHLLAQMLTAQAGLRNFASYRGFRVQRITVHPDYRRQGIGRMLVDRAVLQCRETGLDYVGSSFALDSTTALFWRHAGFRLIHIGSGKGKSTGRQTVAVLRSEHDDINALMELSHNKINDSLPLWLLTYCNSLLWQDVDALLSLQQARFELSALDEDEINAFVDGFRGFDLGRVALARLLMISLPYAARLAIQNRRLLIEKILLDRDWNELVSNTGLAGKKQITTELRRGIKSCYDYYQSQARR